MARRWTWPVGTVFCLALGYAAQQAKVNFKDQDFSLENFDQFSATLESQGIGFNGAGNPLRITSSSSGLTMTAKKAEGKAVRGTGSQLFLQAATLSGGADLNLSSATSGTMRLQSETLNYTGTATKARAEFPRPLTLDSLATGTTDKNAPFSRTVRISGSKGFVTLALQPAANANALRTGELEGPVTITLHNELKGPAPETSDVEATGDALRFDLTTTPATLTLTGNVAMTGKGGTVSGNVTADTLVVTLDANLQPTKVDVTGSPARTRLHQEPPR